MKSLLLSILAFTAICISPAYADPIPDGWVAKNVQPVGYVDVNGHAFKLTMTEKAGRYYLIAATFWSTDVSIVDVTNPRSPKVVKTLPGFKNTFAEQATSADNLLITNMEPAFVPLWADFASKYAHQDSFKTRAPPEAGGLPMLPKGTTSEEGVRLWDISEPTDPKLLSTWHTGSPIGTHRNGYPGGRYAFLTAAQEGFHGHILVILDVEDPRHPTVAGRFWLKGQKDGETPDTPVMPGLHGPAMLNPDGKTLTIAYYPGLINVDISDIEHPKLVGRLEFIGPFIDAGEASVHSALPLWQRGLVVVNGEQVAENCDTVSAPYAAIVDNKDPAKPRLLSILPTPVPSAQEHLTDYCQKGGRFGPHNFNQELYARGVANPQNLLFAAWFNAGLRVFDITDAHLPKETGYFVPPKPNVRTGWFPTTALENQTEDVLVDDRGFAYISDKQWGIFVVRYTGPGADELTKTRTIWKK